MDGAGVMIDPSTVRRIGVFKFRNIGDVLIMTPALRVLRHFFPNATTTAFVNSNTAPMLAGNPHVEKIVSYERKAKRGLARVGLEMDMLRQVRAGKFDLTVDFTSGDRSVWYGLLSGAKYRLGFRYYKWKDTNWRVRAYTHLYPQPDDSMHEVEKHLWLLRQAGIEGPDHALCLQVSAEDAAWAKKYMEESSSTGPLVVVHPVSRWLFKCWDDAFMARTIDWLQSERHVQVVVSSSDNGNELARARNIIGLCRHKPRFIEGTATLGQLSALCARAQCYLGVDTAPMHIAAAVGAPVVALFGPSNAEHWHPWSEQQETLSGPCICRVRAGEHCDWSTTRECLKSITPEQVIEALKRWLP